MKLPLLATSALALVTTFGCSNDCDVADDEAYAKYKQCGIDLGSAESASASASTSTSTVVECTEERKVIRRAFAQCVKDASCDAITGKDQAGYAAYATCISGG